MPLNGKFEPGAWVTVRTDMGVTEPFRMKLNQIFRDAIDRDNIILCDAPAPPPAPQFDRYSGLPADEQRRRDIERERAIFSGEAIPGMDMLAPKKHEPTEVGPDPAAERTGGVVQPTTRRIPKVGDMVEVTNGDGRGWRRYVVEVVGERSVQIARWGCEFLDKEGATWRFPVEAAKPEPLKVGDEVEVLCGDEIETVTVTAHNIAFLGRREWRHVAPKPVPKGGALKDHGTSIAYWSDNQALIADSTFDGTSLAQPAPSLDFVPCSSDVGDLIPTSGKRIKMRTHGVSTFPPLPARTEDARWDDGCEMCAHERGFTDAPQYVDRIVGGDIGHWDAGHRKVCTFVAHVERMRAEERRQCVKT